jgi:hypothetical protein
MFFFFGHSTKLISHKFAHLFHGVEPILENREVVVEVSLCFAGLPIKNQNHQHITMNKR